MTYGLRDSWAIWGARRILNSMADVGRVASRAARPSSSIVYTWQVSNVVLYQPKIQEMLKGPNGAVARYMYKVGKEIQVLARRKVGVKTGKLRNSIRVNPRTWYGNRAVEVGSDLKYAYAHHEGTKPHLIVPTKAQYLRFRAGARIIYTKSVMHPGTKPNRYLKNAMRIVVTNL